MRQIGGSQSTLYSLTRVETDALLAAIRAGQLPEPTDLREEGFGGALVRFPDLDVAQVAISTIESANGSELKSVAG